jgi:hypothetical protein
MDFQKEFDHIINDTKVPEVDNGVTPEVFDDTYCNKEFDIPKDGDGPEYPKVFEGQG